MTTPEPEFERLVLEHLDGLYNLARWLTRNMDEAQDLVQETALKALKARDQFRGGTTLTAWLYRILRNSFIDRYWKRQREPSGQEGDLPGVLGELEQALEETEIEHLRPLVAADINRALKALPEQWRTTVLLAEVDGLTWEEVAEVMGCPLGTVQSRIFRARRVLRQLLKDYAPEAKGEE